VGMGTARRWGSALACCGLGFEVELSVSVPYGLYGTFISFLLFVGFLVFSSYPNLLFFFSSFLFLSIYHCNSYSVFIWGEMPNYIYIYIYCLPRLWDIYLGLFFCDLASTYFLSSKFVSICASPTYPLCCKSLAPFYLSSPA